MMLGRHGLAGKWHRYEDSIHVPLIISDPRIPLEKRNKVDKSMTLNKDLAETNGLDCCERRTGPLDF